MRFFSKSLCFNTRWKMRYPGVGLLLCLGLMASAVAGAGASGEKIVLTVHTADTGPTISRNIFGQFAEHLGRGIYEGIWVGPDSPIPNTRGIRNDVVAALKAIHVPNVRWPGGCFADEYHWRNGIGPANRRPPRSIPTGAASSSRTPSARTSSWTSSSRSAPRPISRSTSARAPRRKRPTGSST